MVKLLLKKIILCKLICVKILNSKELFLLRWWDSEWFLEWEKLAKKEYHKTPPEEESPNYDK